MWVMPPNLCISALGAKEMSGIDTIFSLEGGILISDSLANTEMTKN